MAHGQGGAEIGLTCNHEAPIAAYSASGAGYWREGIGPLRGRAQDSHESICCVTGDITHTLKAEGFDASEDGTGRGQPIIAVHGTQDPDIRIDQAHTLGRNSGQERNVLTPTAQVRRLTPRECERLQGFPDDWTLIPWRKKPAEECPDGPRYKALGNSWAVPVVRWIGRRIDQAITRGAA